MKEKNIYIWYLHNPVVEYREINVWLYLSLMRLGIMPLLLSPKIPEFSKFPVT